MSPKELKAFHKIKQCQMLHKKQQQVHYCYQFQGECPHQCQAHHRAHHHHQAYHRIKKSQQTHVTHSNKKRTLQPIAHSIKTAT